MNAATLDQATEYALGQRLDAEQARRIAEVLERDAAIIGRGDGGALCIIARDIAEIVEPNGDDPDRERAERIAFDLIAFMAEVKATSFAGSLRDYAEAVSR